MNFKDFKNSKKQIPQSQSETFEGVDSANIVSVYRYDDYVDLALFEDGNYYTIFGAIECQSKDIEVVEKFLFENID